MTISAVGSIYDFRTVARANGTHKTTQIPAESAEPRQLDLFNAHVEPERGFVDQDGPENTNQQISCDSVADLLDRFFHDKIMRYDADRDGQLGPQEFYGDAGQFAGLDRDNDGFINAADLKQRFFEDNPEMREMAEGYTHELYDQILNHASADPRDLTAIVESFFSDFVGRHDRDGDGSLAAAEFPGSLDEFEKITGTLKYSIQQKDLVDQFAKENPDLVELQETMAELREMIKQQDMQSQHIDVYI